MAEAAPAEGLDLGITLAAAALLISAFPILAVSFSDRPGPYVVQTFLFWSDVPLMAVGLLRLPDLVRWLLRRRLDVVTALLAVLVALALSWAVHPSLRGGLQVLRVLGVAGAVLSVVRGGRVARRLLVGCLAVLTVAEVLVAVAQRTSGGAVGLRALGEQAEPLVAVGGAEAPMGTLVHPYLLAALALVCIGVLAAVIIRSPARSWASACVVAVAGIAVGLTYSRAALLAVFGLLVPLAVALRSRRTRPAALLVLAATVVGVGATVLVASDGWVGRVQEASTGSDLSRGRGDLTDQAVALIRRHPLVGVGTGQYVLAVEQDEAVAGRSSRALQPVHAVPLLLVAEAGLPAAAAMVLLAVALVRAAARAGDIGWALLLGFAPFLLLDHFPVTFPQGLVMTGAWLACLQVVGDRPSPIEVEPEEASTAVGL